MELQSSKNINSNSNINPANLISVFRILLIPFFFWACFYYLRWDKPVYYVVTIIIFLLISVSDLLDGYFARKLNSCTPLGALLDPLADKLFITTAFVLFAVFKEIPLWLAVIQVSKELIILLGWGIMFTLDYDTSVAPSVPGKYTSFAQFLVVIGVFFFNPVINNILWIATTALIIFSGLSYIWDGLVRANISEKAKESVDE
jgi:cardiolipin synthase